MKIIRDTQRNCARMAAEEYRKLLGENPHCVLGLATGSTPEMLYEELVALCRAGKLSFKDVTTYNLDEYVGLDGSHPQSYRYFMDSHLFNLVDIDNDDEIKQAGGVDLQLLGIGPNGHIGFNEPGTPWDAVTHIVPLTDATRQANKRFFNSIDEVPEKAVSMGIKTVMQSRRIILMAFGKNKAQAVKGMIEGRIDNSVPASILQLHPDCTVYIDDDAASML